MSLAYVSLIHGRPGASAESPANTADPGVIPASGRPSAEGTRNHSSILAWEIPWTEEPGALQSTGLQEAYALGN